LRALLEVQRAGRACLRAFDDVEINHGDGDVGVGTLKAPIVPKKLLIQRVGRWLVRGNPGIPDGMQKMKPSAVSAITVGGTLPVVRIIYRA